MSGPGGLAQGQLQGVSKLGAFTRFADIGLACGVVGIIVVLVIPVPIFVLDLLLCCQFALSLAILLGTLYCNESLEFSGFPSLLLFVTLFRLSLNVASARLILLQADAGHVIQAFGDFVVGGNYVVGFAVFLILVVIQFVVITKGAGRVAEVAARFTLDAMPGKQMAIDADLNAGLIDETQARARRQKIEREASFFGAMDGASKFVRGDAIAALLITAINILGGLGIGVFMQGMELGAALRRYTLLTIGDGLVTQIPALLISTAAGLLVTRSASEFNLGQDLTRQLFLKPRPVAITATFLMIFGLMPGLPTLPFMALAGGLFVLAYTIKDLKPAETAAADASKPREGTAPGGATGGRPAPNSLEGCLKLDVLELELGAALISLVDAAGPGDLMNRIAQIRRKIASELGIAVPSMRIRDNLQLPTRAYRLRLRGGVIADGELFPEQLLAIDPGGARTGLAGTATKDPAFGLPAVWTPVAQRARAEAFGYTVVDAASVLATHLHEALRAQAADLLSRQDTQALVDRVRETDPAAVKDVVPNVVGLPLLHRVSQGLLREMVPVRDMVTILETLADVAGTTRHVESLVEHVRIALSPAFVRTHEESLGKLAALALDPDLEASLMQCVVQSDRGAALVLTPMQVTRFLKTLEEKFTGLSGRRRSLVLICSASIRPHLRRLIERSLPRLTVLSYLEIPRGTQLEIIAQVPPSALGESSQGIFGSKTRDVAVGSVALATP